MSDRKVLVIAYGRESYVEECQWAHRDRLIINGRRDWPRALGCHDFRVVTGKVKTLAVHNEPLMVTTKYTIRPDLACAAKPGWVTPDEYARLPEGDQSLYAPVREAREQNPTPLEWSVVDGLAEPRSMPQGISPVPPSHVNVRPWFWWTLPCQASGDFAFNQLAERVKALDPAQFGVTVYSNIKHLRVELHGLTVGGVTYRPTRALVHIDRGCRGFTGTTLDDVLSQVNAWVDDQMKPVSEALSLSDCPCCGRAWKGLKTLAGRDPKRYARAPKHEIT